MSSQGRLQFSLATPGLKLSAREAPWDSAIFLAPVAQIDLLQVLDSHAALEDYAQYQAWVASEHIGIVSCRLAHDRLRESMLLEANGFRFIEMVLHPRLDGLQKRSITADDLKILPPLKLIYRACVKSPQQLSATNGTISIRDSTQD